MPFKFNATRYRAPSARRCVFATRGMVCSSQPLAAQAGLDILRRGGNAVLYLIFPEGIQDLQTGVLQK